MDKLYERCCVNDLRLCISGVCDIIEVENIGRIVMRRRKEVP